VIGLNALEKRLVDAVNRARLMEYTASIAQWVRLSGTPAERESFVWVQDQLRSFGWQTNLIEHDAYISLPGPATLEVEGLGALEVITHAMARPDEATAQIVYGPDADATGKILLVDGLATPAAALAAQARGARAFIAINDENHHEMIISPVWGSPSVDDLGRLPQVAALSVRQADGERLKLMVQNANVMATYKTEVETGWRKTPLLVADLPGPSSEYVLFSGHLDSWHLGAMDNGTANAVMLEVARLMAGERANLKRGLRLAFWSGHSHGRYSGSAWYVDTHWQDLHDNCVAHVNIDSVGGRNASVLTEGMVTAELHGLGAAVINDYTSVRYEGRPVNRSSDQSLVGVGVPSLWAAFSEQPLGADAVGFTKLFGGNSGGLGWWWHTNQDTMDQIDPVLLLRDGQCYVAAISRLLFSERLPIDPQAAAQSFLEQLQAFAAKGGARFDLSDALARAEQLVAATARLKAAPLDDVQFNHVCIQVSRALIPVQYTEVGAFGHDPALGLPQVPCLKRLDELVGTAPGSDEERFLMPLLHRGRNRVLAALHSALRAVEAVQ
jgi:hypothetical protein